MKKSKRAFRRSTKINSRSYFTVRSRRTLIESLELRQLLTASTPVVVPSPFTHASNPGSFLTIGSTTFFAADDGIHGNELWKTDGTTAGTVMVKDIEPGSDDGIDGYYSDYRPKFVNVNGTLFFVADNFTQGYQLWKSDGTTTGTVMVANIKPKSYGYSLNFNLTSANGMVFFTAKDDVHGTELWESDGTAAGTEMVADINPGSHDSNPVDLTNVNGLLFFSANDGTHGTELWKSDGTDAGTVMVADINPGSGSSVSYVVLTNVNGTLYFNANDGTHGNELWKSDDTAAGTEMVADLNPGNASSYPYNFTNVNGTLFFTANDGTHGNELWKSDGTAAETVIVADINPDSGISNPCIVNVNGTLFFFANDGTNGSQLWKSDGTAAGTVKVADINSGGYNGYFLPNVGLSNVDGTLYFVADTDTQGDVLWKSDGTAAGTMMVADINPGPGNSYVGNLIDANGTLLFTANDGVHGSELWKSDGTAAGTVLVDDINKTTSFYLTPSQLTDVGGTLFFIADDARGTELWKTDGTAAGTVMVADVYPYLFSERSPISDLTDVNGTLFFKANDGIHGYELWKSDGTTAGTVMVDDIKPGRSGSLDYFSAYFTNVNGTLFFVADDGIHGYELWKSDGTTAGTVMVDDIDPGSYGSGPDQLTNFNGTLFFTAYDGTHGNELWKTDGTTAGTVMVDDIDPGNDSSFPYNLTNVNGTLFFTADDGTNGTELWKTDGTAAGTVMLKDIYPGTYTNIFGHSYANSSKPSELTNVDGTLFFTAYDGNNRQLWKSDGTIAGTVEIIDLDIAGPSYNLTNVNGTLFFTSGNVYGTELWKTDGTTAGTVMVKDIYPGTSYEFGQVYGNSSDPFNLININGTLFFVANDGTHGYELWKSDGTDAGTVMVGDINPGSGNSYPYNFTNVNGTLFFEAYPTSGPHVAELLYELAPQLIPGDFNGDGHVDAADLGAAMQAMTNPTAYEAQYNVSDADLNTIGDVNGDGQFNAFDLQRLLILLKTGGGSTEQESVETEQTPTANNPSFATQSAIPSADLGTFSTVEDTSPPANSAQSAASVQAPNDASQPTNNVATSSTADTPTPLADSPLSGNSPISISQEYDSINLSDATNLTVSFGSRSVEPLRVKAAEQTSSEKLASKTANSYLTADSAPHAVVLATVDQTLLDYGDDFRRHSLRQPDSQVFADDSLLSELFASWAQA